MYVIKLSNHHHSTPAPKGQLWQLLDDSLQLIDAEVDLTQLSLEQPVLLVLPGSLVQLLQVKLPKMSHKALRDAIPFAVEEHLAGPYTDCHFAYTQGETQTYVAVVAKNLMRSLQALIQAQSWQVLALVPETLLLPIGKKTWCCYQSGDQLQLRTDKFSGFASHKDQLKLLVDSLLAEHEAPKKVNLLQVDDDLKTIFTRHNIDVKTIDTLYQQQALQQPVMNLLQGEFKIKQRKTKQNFWWRLSLYALMAGLFLFMAADVSSYYVLRAENQKVDWVLRQALHRLGIQSDNPALALRKEAAIAKRRLANNRFHQLMSVVAQTVAQNKHVTLLTMTYDKKILTVKVKAAEAIGFAHFNQQLKMAGQFHLTSKTLPSLNGDAFEEVTLS